MIGLRLLGITCSAYLEGKSSSTLTMRAQNKTEVLNRVMLLLLAIRSEAVERKIIRFQALLLKYILKLLARRSLSFKGDNPEFSPSSSSSNVRGLSGCLGSWSLAQAFQTHFVQSHSGRRRTKFIPATTIELGLLGSRPS